MKMLVVLIALISTCLFGLTPAAEVCTPGEYYTLPDNPCFDCMCGSDGKPTDECEEMACDPPICPEGQWAKPIPGTCCGFEECAPVCADFACPAAVPVCEEGTSLVDRRGPNDCCPVYECAERVCIPGDLYYTLPDNPCKSCFCGPDGQPTDDCTERVCDPLMCPVGQWAKPIPGTCCGFEECKSLLECAYAVCPAGFPSCPEGTLVDRRGPNDCCPDYVCVEPACDDVLCTQGFPVCGEGTSLVDRRGPNDCCPVYECVGHVCTPGGLYTLPNDPCMTCECGYDGQPTKDCMTPSCAAPSCHFGQVLKHEEGTCCGYYCALETWVVIVIAVLGAAIVSGSILALVFCYLYKKKHSVTTPRTDQYYNNLTYSDVDDKKKVPLDNVYVVKDTNDAKLQKEKEAMQNA